MQKRVLRFLPALLWMGVIFWFSAQDGDASGAQSEFVVDLLAHVGLTGPNVELLVRKAAHMTEYAVLCALLHYALSPSLGGGRLFACCLLLCAAYAATDEFHQMFVGGRGPSPVDVAIDSAGAALGGALYALVRRVKRRKN